MCNFHNKFSIVLLISLVFFSYSYSGRNDDIEECIDVMTRSFGLCEHPIECVQFAIKYFKLYGKNKYTFYRHIEAYYSTFYRHVNTDRIELPTEFCDSNKECLKEIRMFEEVTFSSAGPSGTSSSAGPSEISISEKELNILNSFDVVKKNSSAGPSGIILSEKEMNIFNSSQKVMEDSSAGPSGISISENEFNILNSFEEVMKEGPSIKNLKHNVMYNALYYHVIVVPPFEVPTDETSTYFHKPGSYGQLYLTHISVNISLSGLKNPYQFCQDL